MMRETTVTPLGLITRPSENGQYPPGALSTALNVCMRAPGVLQPLPARSQYAANGGGVNAVDRIWATDSTLLVHAQASGLFWVTASTRNQVTLPSGWPLGKQYARMVRARNRFIIGTSGGPVTMDSEGATTSRYTGLARPGSIDVQSMTAATTDQAISDGDNVNYRAIIVRRGSDGYLLQSAPTNILNVENAHSAPVAVTIRVQWLSTNAYAVGDVVELYRTVSQTTGTDPGNVYRLCATKTLDASDVSNERADITDNCADANLGAELYTNPGQPTQSRRANRTPSLARDIATLNGYTFYNTPYSHARATLKILGAVAGDGTYLQNNNIAHGIGVRLGSGTFTSGNTLITGVSAATYTGLAVGQEIVSVGGFTDASARVASFNQGASTITMTVAAVGTSGATGLYTRDRIEINGTQHRFDSLAGLATNVTNGTDEIDVLFSAYMRKRITNTSTVLNVETNSQVTMLIETPYFAGQGGGPLTIRATNGQNYSPRLNDFTGGVQTFVSEERKNRLTYSKLDQPEHVPEENELLVGQGAIHRLIATKDCLFAFCSDGLYRITGDGGLFRVDVVDPSLRLATRSSVDTMLDDVWAYTNRGLVVIGPEGVRQEISQARIGDLIAGGQITDDATDASTTQFTAFLTCDPHNREVRLCIRSGGTSTLYIYNALTDRFTTASDAGAEIEVVAETYAPYLSSIVWSVRAQDASTPLYRYATDGSTRSDADVRFQPLFGTKEPFTLKQWSDFEFLFRSVGNSSMTCNMIANGAITVADVFGTEQNDEWRFVCGVSIEDAMAASCAFGFAPSGGAAEGWRLVGLSARFVPLSQQVEK